MPIKDILDNGATALVPKIDTSGSEKLGFFNRSLFKYQPDKDIYICPAGNELDYHGNNTEHGMDLRYYSNCKACKECTIRSQCTRSKTQPRRMHRREHEGVIEDMERRLLQLLTRADT